MQGLSSEDKQHRFYGTVKAENAVEQTEETHPNTQEQPTSHSPAPANGRQLTASPAAPRTGLVPVLGEITTAGKLQEADRLTLSLFRLSQAPYCYQRGSAGRSLQRKRTWGTEAGKGQILSLFLLQTILSSFPVASKLCLPMCANTDKELSRPGFVLGPRKDPHPPASGAARPLPAGSRVAERRPAVRGGPGSLARGSALQPGGAFPARRNEADAGLSEGLAILPGARPPAFCPLGSAEPASPCFHSLRRRRPLVSPPPPRSQAAGRARSGAGSLCPPGRPRGLPPLSPAARAQTPPAEPLRPRWLRGRRAQSQRCPRRRAPLSRSERDSAESLVFRQPKRFPRPAAAAAAPGRPRSLPSARGRRPERSRRAPVTNFRFVKGRVSGIRRLKSHYKTRPDAVLVCSPSRNHSN